MTTRAGAVGLKDAQALAPKDHQRTYARASGHAMHAGSRNEKQSASRGCDRPLVLAEPGRLLPFSPAASLDVHSVLSLRLVVGAVQDMHHSPKHGCYRAATLCHLNTACRQDHLSCLAARFAYGNAMSLELSAAE